MARNSTQAAFGGSAQARPPVYGKGTGPTAAATPVAGGRGSRVAAAGGASSVKGYTPGNGRAASGSFAPKGRTVARGSSRNAKPGRAGKRR